MPRFPVGGIPHADTLLRLLPWLALGTGVCGLTGWHATGGHWPEYKALAYSSALVLVFGAIGLLGVKRSAWYPRFGGWLVISCSLVTDAGIG